MKQKSHRVYNQVILPNPPFSGTTLLWLNLSTYIMKSMIQWDNVILNEVSTVL